MASFDPTWAWAAAANPLDFRPVRLGFQTSTVDYHGGPLLLSCAHDLTLGSARVLLDQLAFSVRFVEASTGVCVDTLPIPRVVGPSARGGGVSW